MDDKEKRHKKKRMKTENEEARMRKGGKRKMLVFQTYSLRNPVKSE